MKLCTCLLCVYIHFDSLTFPFRYLMPLLLLLLLLLEQFTSISQMLNGTLKHYPKKMKKKKIPNRRRRRRWNSVYFSFTRWFRSLVRFCNDCFLFYCWSARYSSPYRRFVLMFIFSVLSRFCLLYFRCHTTHTSIRTFFPLFARLFVSFVDNNNNKK